MASARTHKLKYMIEKNVTNDKYDVRNYKVVKFVLYDGTGEAKKEAVETALNVDGKDRNTM